jgi:hypothetical protein
MDLENGVYEMDALQRLETWESRSHNLLEGGTGKTKFRVSPAAAAGKARFGAADDAEEEPTQEKRQSYSDLFDK